MPKIFNRNVGQKGRRTEENTVRPHLQRPRNVDGTLKDIPVPAPVIPDGAPLVTDRRDAEYQLVPKVFSYNPFGKQITALSRPENEIYYGGGRGGGKSFCQQLWLSRLALERLHGVLRYPNYSGLVIRKHFEDLKGWIQEATQLYKKLEPDVQAVGKPTTFRWPGGPIIDTGHLDGDKGFENYQGQSRHKLGVDEINQIGNVNIYLPMLGSVRMSPDGLSQVFATGNPGGDGDHWVKERWIDVRVNGQLLDWGTPFLDPQSGLSRIFIQSLVFDNPYIMADTAYIGMLKSQSPARQRQWIYGDWNAIEGSFFYDFRQRHLKGEPANAYHCVKSRDIELRPYYRRWISVDWGYNDYCAIYWWVQHEDGRVYTYNEMILRRISAFQVGVLIAQASYKDLSNLQDSSMDMFLSPDAFSKEGAENCRAQQISNGIKSVLGKDSSIVLAMTDDERHIAETDTNRAVDMFVRHVAETLPGSGITVRPANNNRIDGWAFMNEMLRWEATDSIPEVAALEEQIRNLDTKEAIALTAKILNARRSDDTLPKWRIMEDKCPRLVSTIPMARINPLRQNDVVEFAGIDPLDSARYGLMGYRDMPAEMPKAYYVQELIHRYKSMNPNADINVLHSIWVNANKRWEDRQSKGTPIKSFYDERERALEKNLGIFHEDDDYEITELTSPFEHV